MPSRLKRYQTAGDTHFVTFSCFHRKPLLSSAAAKKTFEEGLERLRRCYGLRVFGYVVMPEHIHLLVSEPERKDLATAIKSLKQGVAVF
jgi:putative transposase